MRDSHLLVWARRHVRWLLALVLLLPSAQLAAAVHVLSHVTDTAQTQREDADAAHIGQCELCTLAAVAGGGALPSAAATHHVHATAAEHVTDAPPVRVAAAFTRVFDSRAPPALLH